jgi:hypothetical protein
MTDEGRPDGPDRRLGGPGAMREWGWYAYPPEGAELAEDDGELDVRELGIDLDEHAGPWQSDEGVLDGFEELHSIGVSRGLYDDVMAWHQEATEWRRPPTAAETRATEARGRELRRRLRAELPARITVREPHEEWTTHLYLHVMEITPQGLRFVSLDRRSRAARTLRRQPRALVERLRAWQQQLASLPPGWPETDPGVARWHAEGRAIADEIQRALGEGFEVHLYPP